jgi:phosphoglycerate kinase
MEVGKSLVSDIDLTGNPIVHNEKLLLPVDMVVKRGEQQLTVAPTDVQPDDVILDAGPETVSLLELFARGAKTILWNGPLGNYEAGYDEGTTALAKVIAASEGYSVVGGGDTIAAIESLGLSGQFGFLSTGGGAMLAFLEHGTLPAIEALQKS